MRNFCPLSLVADKASLVAAVLAGLALACSSLSGTTDTGGTSGQATGGNSATGGVTSTGGVGTGGETSTGGTASTGGALGTGGGAVGGAKGGAGGSKGGSTGAAGGASGALDCASLQLCEDFESGSLGSAWKLSKSGQFTAAIGTDQAHSGTHSLHVGAPNSGDSAFMSETKTFPASDFWGRAWLRFKTPTLNGHQMNIYLALPGDQLRVLNRQNSEAIKVNVQSTDVFYTSKTTITEDTWFCYEWHVTASATQIFKDGVELTDIKAPGGKGFTSLNVGYQRFQTGGAGDLWIDDVAVNPTQIGCK